MFGTRQFPKGLAEKKKEKNILIFVKIDKLLKKSNSIGLL